ncbi:MAG: hypothetical protein ACTS2F_30775 [Thainema sp.]
MAIDDVDIGGGVVALPHLIAIFDGDLDTGFGGQVMLLALPANRSLILFLFLLGDDGGEDAVDGATAGVIRRADRGGVAFHSFGNLGTAHLPHPAIPFAIGLQDEFAPALVDFGLAFVRARLPFQSLNTALAILLLQAAQAAVTHA